MTRESKGTKWKPEEDKQCINNNTYLVQSALFRNGLGAAVR